MVDPEGLNPLRDNLPANPFGQNTPWQAHHVIPKEIWAQHGAFFNNIGLTGNVGSKFSDLNAAQNGIALPSTLNCGLGGGSLPIHNSSHSGYSADVNKWVNKIEKKWNANKMDPKKKACADFIARQHVRALQGFMKTKLSIGQYGSCNNGQRLF